MIFFDDFQLQLTLWPTWKTLLTLTIFFGVCLISLNITVIKWNKICFNVKVSVEYLMNNAVHRTFLLHTNTFCCFFEHLLWTQFLRKMIIYVAYCSPFIMSVHFSVCIYVSLIINIFFCLSNCNYGCSSLSFYVNYFVPMDSLLFNFFYN